MNMSEIFATFLTILLEFLFELYIFHGLFLKNLTKRKNFLLRTILGFIPIIAISFGLSIPYYYYSNLVWVRISIYLILFLLSVIHVLFCYKESLGKTFFCCLMSYAAQNLFYKVFLFIFCAVVKLNLTSNWGLLWSVWYRVFYYTILSLTSILVYYGIAKKVSKNIAKKELNIQLLVVSIIVFFVTIVLCSLDDIYFKTFGDNLNEYNFADDTIFVLREANNLFSIICCITILLLMSVTCEEDNLKQEVRYLQHIIRQSEKQYEISKETINMINIKCHDIKYKLHSNILSKEEEKTLKDLENSISIYDTNIETGNKLLNVLFTEKSLYCEQKGIKFTCMIDGEKLNFIEDGDLYCLFGNITDNALEAVTQIEKVEKRIINMIVKSKGDLILIQSENFYSGDLRFENGFPITTKQDKNYHGFGMQSIKMIVDKYNGTMTTSAEDGIFHLNILFNLQDMIQQNK